MNVSILRIALHSSRSRTRAVTSRGTIAKWVVYLQRRRKKQVSERQRELRGIDTASIHTHTRARTHTHIYIIIYYTHVLLTQRFAQHGRCPLVVSGEQQQLVNDVCGAVGRVEQRWRALVADRACSSGCIGVSRITFVYGGY